MNMKATAFDNVSIDSSSLYKVLELYKNINSFYDMIRIFDSFSDSPEVHRIKQIAFKKIYMNFFFKCFANSSADKLWDTLGLRARWTDEPSTVPGAANVITDDAGNQVYIFPHLSKFRYFHAENKESGVFLEMNDVAMFSMACQANNIPKSRRVIFTSLEGIPVFSEEHKRGNDLFSILDSNLQRFFIEDNSTFFEDLRKELQSKATSVNNVRFPITYAF